MSETKVQSRGLEPATVHALAALARRNDNSIVSRTLMNTKSGSLTLFVFAEGQKLSEHTSPYDALAHVLEGEAEIVIDGTPFAMGKDQVILMPQNVPHAVNARKGFTMLLTMFKTNDSH